MIRRRKPKMLTRTRNTRARNEDSDPSIIESSPETNRERSPVLRREKRTLIQAKLICDRPRQGKQTGRKNLSCHSIFGKTTQELIIKCFKNVTQWDLNTGLVQYLNG